MNINYGKVVNGKLILAPDSPGRFLGRYTEEMMAAYGYWPIDREVPAAPGGQMAVATGVWEEVVIQEEVVPEVGEDGMTSGEYVPLKKVCRQRYRFVPVHEPEPVPELEPVKRYSKKRFDLALAKRGIFAAFDAWATSTEVVPGSGLTVARVLADSWYMSSDDEEFLSLKAVAEAQFGAERIADVLAESEDEEW